MSDELKDQPAPQTLVPVTNLDVQTTDDPKPVPAEIVQVPLVPSEPAQDPAPAPTEVNVNTDGGDVNVQPPPASDSE